MAYQEIGVFPKDFGGYLPAMCEDIIVAGGGAGGAWEAAVTTALVGGLNLPQNKFLSSTIVDEVTALSGNTRYPAGGVAYSQLLHVTLLLLHKLGVTPDYPVAYEYRADWRMTLDEVISRIITTEITFPTVEDVGGPNARWATFTAVLVRWIRQIAKKERLRALYSERLRRAAQGIGWRVARGEQISQAERTLFLMLAPGSSRAKLATEVMPPPLLVAETTDPAVWKAFEVYQATNEVGPASKYVNARSMRVDRGTQYTVMPAPGPLDVSLGIRINYGPFAVYETKPVFTIPWTEQSQLEAVYERTAPLVFWQNNELAYVRPPVQAGYAHPHYVCASLDDADEFELSYQDLPGQQTPVYLSSFHVEYKSKLIGRTLSTWLNTFPGSNVLYYEMSATDRSYGNSTAGPRGIPADVLIDPSACTGIHFGGHSFTQPSVANNFVFFEEIIYPDPVAGVIYSSLVDMRPLLYTWGTLATYPAGLDHVLPPRSWMYEPQDAAESFIVGRLGVNTGLLRVIEESVRVSHNMSKYAGLLPLTSLPSVSPYNVAISRL